MPELIDRTAITEQLRAIEQNGKLTDAQKFRLAKFAVENAPTIEPEVRHGRWILIGRGRITKSRDLKCSVCGNYFRVYDDVTLNAGRGDANFCPNCGARMDGGAEDVT